MRESMQQKGRVAAVWKTKMGILVMTAAAYLCLTGFGYEVKRDVNVRQEPSAESQKLGYLEEDEEVCVLQEQDGWGKIIYKGREAFVSMHYLRELEYDVTVKLEYEEPLIINVLGDSIVYGENLVSQAEAWPALLGELCGADVRNYGVKATTIAINNESSFLERYRKMEQDANLVLVMGGTNDFGLATPLGSPQDLMPGCFYGGLNDLISGLKAQYPGVPIIFMTPMHREKEEFPNKQGVLLSDYVEAIRYVCEIQGVYVLDLYEAEVLNFRDSMPLYMPDGLHPNEKGHRILADFIYESLFVGGPEDRERTLYGE